TPGSLIINGAVLADASGVGSNAGPAQAGAVRQFARGGSQLSLASLTSTANGSSPVFALRGGLLADQGSTISIVGDALVSSGVDLGLNDGGTITAGGVLQVTAGGQVLAGFATPSAGAVGTVTASQVAIDAGSGVSLATTLGGGSSVFVRGFGPVTVGAVTSGGDIGLVAQSTLTSGALTSGRDLVLLAGGTVTTGALATPTTGRVRIGDFAQQSLISFTATGPDYSALFAAASSAVPGDIVIGGTVTTGLFDASATGLLRVTGTINAAIGATLSGNALQLADANSPGFLDLTSATSVVLGNLAVTGALSVTSGGSITTGNITTGQSLLLSAAQPGAALATGNIRSDGEIRLLSATTLATGSLSAGDRVTLDAGGALTTAAIDAGTVNPAAGATGVLSATAQGALSTGPISVAGSASLAGRLVTLNGSLTAPTATISASDIAIAPGSVIGGASATSLTLVIDPASTAAVIGGAGVATPGTYSLSNAEFGTLRADTITVQTAAGSMTLDTLALAAVSPATGLATNQVNLSSGGVLRVTGAVSMAQSGAQNRLALTSGSRIEVVQGSGSVRLGAGVDSLTGTLALTAPRIWVASDALLTQLAGGQLIGPARDNALNAAGTPAVAGGSVGAGTIQISAVNEVLIQNSGTRPLPAGFTAGPGGLSISRAGQGNGLIDVVINGRIQLKDNSFATGQDTVALVQFAAGSLTAGSQVNGCVIGGVCASVLPDTVSQPVLTIVNNVKALTPEEVARREAARAATERLPIVVLQRLIDYGPLFADPDANDPVTSGGNPALWLEPDPRRNRAQGGQK
uniref:beta strand repeat-containing protein n=1 Tax=Sandarakinorhabdus oryzae TaxID=2675220 RepID=UPI0018CC56D0